MIPWSPLWALAAYSLCIRLEHSGQLMLILSLKKVIRPLHSSNARRRKWEGRGGREGDVEERMGQTGAFLAIVIPGTIHPTSNYEP